jgi:hypothetical protein
MTPWALSIFVRHEHFSILQGVIEYFLSALSVFKLSHRQIFNNYEILSFFNVQILINKFALTIKLLLLKQINNFVVVDF